MFENAKFIYENSLGKRIEFSTETGPFRLFIDGITGLSHQNVTINTVKANGQDGSFVLSQVVEPKQLGFNGDIDIDIFNNRDIMLRTIFPKDTGKLYYQDDNGDMWYMVVHPVSTPNISTGYSVQNFQFKLLAPFPFWLSAKGQEIVTFNTYTSLYKYPQSFSGTIPWKISEKIEESIKNIYNDSVYDIGFTVVFKCNSNVINPHIINTLTQEEITIETAFLPFQDSTGFSFIVTTVEGRKTVQVVEPDGYTYTNLNMVTDDSSFFKLHPFDNPIQFGADINVEGLEVAIYFDKIKVGV